MYVNYTVHVSVENLADTGVHVLVQLIRNDELSLCSIAKDH